MGFEFTRLPFEVGIGGTLAHLVGHGIALKEGICELMKFGHVDGGGNCRRAKQGRDE